MESKSYRLNESKMFADITDGIAIIINAATGIYYGMNGYGTGIFDNLLAGSSTDDILAAIQEIPGAPANAEESLSAFLETMLGFEIAHVGVNTASEADALKAAERFGFIFGMPVKNGNSSVFAGSAVEFMKEPYLGKNGHIAIRTNYIERAVNYLSTVLGVEFDETFAKRDAKGALKAIYMKEEIGGFAVHLVNK